MCACFPGWLCACLSQAVLIYILFVRFVEINALPGTVCGLHLQSLLLLCCQVIPIYF
jgi:hypothetical protein